MQIEDTNKIVLNSYGSKGLIKIKVILKPDKSFTEYPNLGQEYRLFLLDFIHSSIEEYILTQLITNIDMFPNPEDEIYAEDIIDDYEECINEVEVEVEVEVEEEEDKVEKNKDKNTKNEQKKKNTKNEIEDTKEK